MRSPVLLVLAVLALSSAASIDAVDCKIKTKAPVPITVPPTLTPSLTSTSEIGGDATPTPTRQPRKPRRTPQATTKTPTTAKPAAVTAAPVGDNDDGDASEGTPAPATVTPTATKSPAPVSTSVTNSTATPAANTTGGKCVTGDPTSGYISKADVDWIWEKRMKPHFDFKNFIFDQLLASNGKLSYCVRWDSSNKLSKATAAKFQSMLAKQYAQWNKWLEGYGCWPFAKIELEMVGVAVRNANQLDWTDSSLGPIYAGVLDADGIPMCPEACYKHRNFEAASDTSACKGKPFDMSLWPTLGQGGGAGGDWGQRVDEANMLSSLDAPTSVIVAHEIGHGFGLPDFYEEGDKPHQDMAKMVMEAGASQSVTEADGWLIRRAWEHVRMKYPKTSG